MTWNYCYADSCHWNLNLECVLSPRSGHPGLKIEGLESARSESWQSIENTLLIFRKVHLKNICLKGAIIPNVATFTPRTLLLVSAMQQQAQPL